MWFGRKLTVLWGGSIQSKCVALFKTICSQVPLYSCPLVTIWHTALRWQRHNSPSRASYMGVCYDNFEENWPLYKEAPHSCKEISDIQISKVYGHWNVEGLPEFHAVCVVTSFKQFSILILITVILCICEVMTDRPPAGHLFGTN